VVLVTPAEPVHTEAMTGLFEEMDRFYGDVSVGSRAERAEQITAALFGDVPAGAALLAWDAHELVGVAAYSFLWPAVGVTRSLYLKELYVGEAHRRGGVGRRLMDALFEVAVRHGCSRVEWTTDRPNTAAQQFYARIGAPVHEGKLFYRVEVGNQAAIQGCL
jgi:GNAT superfamily N-acetyltransferase